MLLDSCIYLLFRSSDSRESTIGNCDNLTILLHIHSIVLTFNPLIHSPYIYEINESLASQNVLYLTSLQWCLRNKLIRLPVASNSLSESKTEANSHLNLENLSWNMGSNL